MNRRNGRRTSSSSRNQGRRSSSRNRSGSPRRPRGYVDQRRTYLPSKSRSPQAHGTTRRPSRRSKLRSRTPPISQRTRSKTSTITCHNCGRSGHISTQCRRPDHFCSNCGLTGHTRDHCHYDQRRTTYIGRSSRQTQSNSRRT